MKTTIGLVLSLVSIYANALPIDRAHPGMLFPTDGIVMPESFTADYDFEGIVALNNCSGSIIRFETSSDADMAVVLSNGHCFEGGFIDPGKFFVAKKSSRSFTVLSKGANPLGKILATELLYGTMTTTDISLYRTNKSYAAIEKDFGVKPLRLAATPAQSKTPIEVISGYWKRGYSCAHNGNVHKLKEGGWTWDGSIRYSQPGCEVIGGTSGSPVLEAGTRNVIGVNNTINENGQKCTLNNPCEEDENGDITFEQGLGYAQLTTVIYNCLSTDNKIDLNLSTCKLPH